MEYVACVSALLLVTAWHLLILYISPILGLIKPNFKHETIHASYGIIMLGYMLAGLAIYATLSPPTRVLVIPMIFTASSMCILGFVDDVFGSRAASGFRGHFKMLLNQGKLTTGAAKAIGGGLAGIVAGYYISNGNIVQWILTALLIPLGANTLNLLDLRPGRASGVLLFGMLAIAPFTFVNGNWGIVALVAAVTLAFAIPDGLGKAMMGDSGSNQLGAILGALVASQTHILFQITAVICMVGIQLYSEKNSITALIERNPLLRKIDRILGVR